MREILLDIRRDDSRYSILIGGFGSDGIAREVENRLSAKQVVVVADRRVAALYGLEAHVATRPGWRLVPADAGEEHKTADGFVGLCETILAGGIDRKTVLVAIGGGVVGDMAGFAAATLLRGIRFVQVPTTLLAQVDSSVGGKTGINMAGGKNLLGAFYQPELVLVDPGFLATLSEREYLSGLAEAAKYGVLGDGEFFDSLVGSADALSRRDPETLAGVIEHCCRMKADIVGNDERESAGRQLLNLGHTFGHALESLAGYDGTLLHGEAVAVGMLMAAAYSVREGLMSAGEAERMADGFDRLGLLRRMSDELAGRLDGGRLAAALVQDKKAADGGLTLVLPTAIGACRVVKNVPAETVADFMRERIAGAV